MKYRPWKRTEKPLPGLMLRANIVCPYYVTQNKNGHNSYLFINHPPEVCYGPFQRSLGADPDLSVLVPWHEIGIDVVRSIDHVTRFRRGVSGGCNSSPCCCWYSSCATLGGAAQRRRRTDGWASIRGWRPVWRELRQSCEWGEFDPCLVVTSDVWVTVLPRVDGPVANACRSLVSEARSVRQKLELSLEKVTKF